MSLVDYSKSHSSHHATTGETLVRNGLVALLFAVALVAMSIGKLSGKSFSESIWKEAKQTAHAVVGYAFKY